MEDYIQEGVTGDADAVTSELYIENAIENPAWYTVEDKHVSLVSENVEKVINLESDMLDDCMWDPSKLECQYVSENSTYLNHGNKSVELFNCYICGENFDLNHLLKNHLDEHKRQLNGSKNKCKFCGKRFKLLFHINRHIQKHHNTEFVKKFDSSLKTNGRQLLSRDVTGKNSSDHTRLVNCNSITVSTASQNSIANNYCKLNLEKEKNLCASVRERNSSDQVDSVNSIESTLANEPRDLMAKQNHNSIESIVRETPYFCIRKLPNIKNNFFNNNYDQTSQNKFIFLCRICKNVPSTDIHSFALHMSDHSECSMHECVVCDETFESVVLWTYHMFYHEQQIELNVSTVQFNHIETESNTFDNNNSRNMEPQVFRNLRNRKSKKSSVDDSHSGITRLDSANQLKYQYDYSTSKKVFPSNSDQLRCRICMKTYSSSNYRIKHEKNIHNITSDGTPLKRNKANHINGVECELCGKIYSSVYTLVRHTSTIHKQTDEPTFTCNVCGSTFKNKFTYKEHIKTKHKQSNIANIKLEEHTKISTSNKYKCDDCDQTFGTNRIRSIHILKNHSANISTSNKNEHVDNYEGQNASLGVVNNKFVQCEVCLKILKTPKYLSSHMIIHTGVKPLNCEKCNRAYRFKSNLRKHQKTCSACYIP